MTTPLLSDVCDPLCLMSANPIRFDNAGASFVRGAAAIILRILYRWCTLVGTVKHAPDFGISTPLLDIEGATLSPQDLRGLRASLTKQAKLESFVKGASVAVSLSDVGLLSVAALVTLDDGSPAGKVYPLEIGPVDAYIALNSFKLSEATIAIIRTVVAEFTAQRTYFG